MTHSTSAQRILDQSPILMSLPPPGFKAFAQIFAQGAVPAPPSPSSISRALVLAKRLNAAAVSAIGVFAIVVYGSLGLFVSPLWDDHPILTLLATFFIGSIFFFGFTVDAILPFIERLFGSHEPALLLAEIGEADALGILALCLEHPELEAYRQAVIPMGRSLIAAEAEGFKAFHAHQLAAKLASERLSLEYAESQRQAAIEANIEAEIAQQRESAERRKALAALASPTHCALAPTESANLAARDMLVQLRANDAD